MGSYGITGSLGLTMVRNMKDEFRLRPKLHVT